LRVFASEAIFGRNFAGNFGCFGTTFKAFEVSGAVFIDPDLQS